MATLTIPKKLFKNDDLILIPKKEFEKLNQIVNLISEDQIWFWTKEWQEKEKEATQDIKLKRLSAPIKNKIDLKNKLTSLRSRR